MSNNVKFPHDEGTFEYEVWWDEFNEERAAIEADEEGLDE